MDNESSPYHYVSLKMLFSISALLGQKFFYHFIFFQLTFPELNFQFIIFSF